MLSELFQLDELPQDDEESLGAGGSEDSYSDDDGEEKEETEPTEDSDEGGSDTLESDRKAVAVISSVGELSVPEKYTSTHQIRVRTLGRDLINIRFVQANRWTFKEELLFSHPCSPVVLSPFLMTRRRNADTSWVTS